MNTGTGKYPFLNYSRKQSNANKHGKIWKIISQFAAIYVYGQNAASNVLFLLKKDIASIYFASACDRDDFSPRFTLA